MCPSYACVCTPLLCLATDRRVTRCPLAPRSQARLQPLLGVLPMALQRLASQLPLAWQAGQAPLLVTLRATVRCKVV